MGGALALHTGLRLKTSLAGIFAMSSFLNDGSAVYSHLKNLNQTGNLEYDRIVDFCITVSF